MNEDKGRKINSYKIARLAKKFWENNETHLFAYF